MLQETVRELSRLLARTLRHLGDVGDRERACELAAEAWALLREAEPREAERMNGVLHYLTSARCTSGNVPDGKEGEHVERERVEQERMERERVENERPARDFDLEVRHLAPAQRHELILETYRKLEPGQGFILINDHDPKPLYYQFAFEHPDAFTWDPVESGPEVWRVRIGKPRRQPD